MASKKINEILECSVCLDRFTRPKVLPCQHTYCYECLQSLAEAGGKTTVQCPQCRKEYKIPDPEGVDGFPANLIINHLLSLNAESDNDESESTKSSEPISQGAECCDCKKKSLVATSDSSSDCHGVSAALSALSCSTQEATEGKNHSPDVNIKVGDRVRRRQTVTTPRYDWGEVTSASVGMVRSINGDEFVIDFPQSKNCIGVLSEIELVPDIPIKVGDRVRVKQTIAKPRNEWGKVARASVGFVRSIEGEKLKIDFPEQLSWNGILSEMELVPDVGIKVGDKVRVKKTVKMPRNNWGKVTHGSVGIVKAIEGEKLKVDFPDQLSWNGLLSEMELAQDIIKVGDRVRVKPTIETPRTSWGNVSHGCRRQWSRPVNEIASGSGATEQSEKKTKKVTTESATGSTASNKVRTTLTISVEGIEFDTQACVLRLRGRNVEENQYVKMGAYHTLDLELNRKFTLAKREWDSIALDRLELACDAAQRADLAAVVMQEGLAHVCLVTGCMTLVRAKIDMSIPRKRRGQCSQHDKGMTRFYDAIIQAIIRHVNFDIVKCMLIASPGFVKDQFFDYMMSQAVKLEHKSLLENKSKFILVHSSSGFKHSLKEVLSDPAVSARLADTKAAGEVRALEEFYQMLQTDPNRAYYGLRHCQAANEAQAIETLMVSDELFRSSDIEQRRCYVSLVDSVRDNGGDVKIFSSLHVSGEQLTQLSGVAAILRFPIPEQDDSDPSSSDSD